MAPMTILMYMNILVQLLLLIFAVKHVNELIKYIVWCWGLAVTIGTDMESKVANTDSDYCNVLDISECNEQMYSVIHFEEFVGHNM